MTTQLPRLKALSINQPWAWLIAHAYKDIENRNWNTPYRGEFLIHTGLRFDRDFDYYHWEKIIGREIPKAIEMPRGGIIGKAEIVGSVQESDSPWFFGEYGFVLENAVCYPEIIPCIGQLGFFWPDYSSRYTRRSGKERKMPNQGNLI